MEAAVDLRTEKPSRERPEARELVLELPWEEIEQAARGLKFGTVVITYHQGRPIQIERIERKRLG
ncbi:MAG: YezD family protein [Nitrospirae bacterium]|nr:YezD family protein [Nitrospirota bacterium]